MSFLPKLFVLIYIG